MSATAATRVTNHNHVRSFSPNEWEDEALLDQPGATPSDAGVVEKPKKVKNLRHAAAALRSSLTGMRPNSASGPRSSSSGRRESASGFVGSLLHGLANAVGLNRDNSPARESSIRDLSNGRSRTGSEHSSTLARLSSAAMMRTEIQSLSQYSDLRNDSFTSRSCAKLRRRSSLPIVSDASISVPAPAPIPEILTATSGDLDRRSAPLSPYIASSRLTCPGELPFLDVTPSGAATCSYDAAAVAATAVALATPPAREPHSKATAAAASSFETAAAGTAAVAPPSGDAADNGRGNGFCPRRSSSGMPLVQGALMVEIPSLPRTLSPHPPLHRPPQTRPSGSSLSPMVSRATSCDHLPPMTPLSNTANAAGGLAGLQSVRDRPPTPRGSPSSALARVLGSFHLPDILISGSGRSTTERRNSVTGGSGASFTRPADIGMPRSRRNSVCSGLSVTGPGGAAISASLAKRFAAAAAATTSTGGGSTLPSPVAPSSSSWTSQSRPSALLGAVRDSRAGSVSKAASQWGGILQNFQNSLELDEDGALAAVDVEFDRRFGQPPPDVPGAVDGVSPVATPTRPSPQHPQPHHLQPLTFSPNHPHLQQQQQQQQQMVPPPPPLQQSPPGRELAPRAPAFERISLQGTPRRSYLVVENGGGGGSSGTGASALGAVDISTIRQALRRSSCSAILAIGGPDDAGADNVLLSSMDAVPTYEHLSNKMRLASIRLSYVEGIVGNGAAAVATHTSLDMPAAPAALSARGPSVTLTPQPPAGVARPLSSRPPGPAHMAAAAVAGGAPY